MNAVNYMTECDKTYSKRPDHALIQTNMLNKRKRLMTKGADKVIKNLNAFKETVPYRIPDSDSVRMSILKCLESCKSRYKLLEKPKLITHVPLVFQKNFEFESDENTFQIKNLKKYFPWWYKKWKITKTKSNAVSKLLEENHEFEKCYR